MSGSELTGLARIQPGEKEQGWRKRGKRESPEAQVRPQRVAVGTRDSCCAGAGESQVPQGCASDCTQTPMVTEEGKGETEIRSPCECEALVQFQTNTMAILQSLTEKNILWGDAWACWGTGQPGDRPHTGKEGMDKWEQGEFSAPSKGKSHLPTRPSGSCHFLSTFTCSDDGQTRRLGKADCQQEVILAEGCSARTGHGDIQ